MSAHAILNSLKELRKRDKMQGSIEHFIAFCSKFISSKWAVSLVKIQKFPKSLTFETPILKLAVCPLNIHNFKF